MTRPPEPWNRETGLTGHGSPEQIDLPALFVGPPARLPPDQVVELQTQHRLGGVIAEGEDAPVRADGDLSGVRLRASTLAPVYAVASIAAVTWLSGTTMLGSRSSGSGPT